MKRIFFVVLTFGLIVGGKQSGPKLVKEGDSVLAPALFPSAEYAENRSDEKISVESEGNDIIQSAVQPSSHQKK